MNKPILLGAAAMIALTGAAAVHAQHPTPFPSDPPHATVGQCYQRIRIEAEYETVMETVVIADGYEIYDVTDPNLDVEQRSYISREAGMRYVVTEPVYETVTEQVQVRPGYVRYEVTPARHETVTERVLVREGRLVWRRGYVEGARQVRHDPETGEIWCLVEEPAEYRTVHRTVVAEPARIHEVPVQPEFATISRQVLVRPATVEEIPIPAERDAYTVHVLAEEARVNRRMSPQQTDTITRHELVSNERYEWRLVDCMSIDIPGHPSAMPPRHAPSGGAQHHPSASALPQSRIITVPQGDDPYADTDYRDHDGVPMASADTSRLHPGAPQRRTARP